MSNPSARELELLGPLSQEDRRTLEGPSPDARQGGADQDLTGPLPGSAGHGIPMVNRAEVVLIPPAPLLGRAERQRC